MLINITRTDQSGERLDAAAFDKIYRAIEYSKSLLAEANEKKEDIELIISFKYEEV